jgi:hypothetical protein
MSFIVILTFPHLHLISQRTIPKSFKMHSTTIFSVLAATLSAVSAQTTTYPITGTLGNATVVENNPPGVIYTANLPPTSFVNPADPRGNVKGSVSGTANPNGIGVAFQVSFSNLPTSGGPFRKSLYIFTFELR